MDFSVSLSCQTETSCRGACDDSELAKVNPRDFAVLRNQGNTVPWQPAFTFIETAHYGLCSFIQLLCVCQSRIVADLTPSA